MGELTLKTFFTGLSMILLLQLYTIVTGIYYEETANGVEQVAFIPDHYARWVSLNTTYTKERTTAVDSIETTGFGLWSWVNLSKGTATQTHGKYEVFLSFEGLGPFLLSLCISVLVSTFITIWLLVVFVLGLKARSKALIRSQLIWSRLLSISFVGATVLALVPICLQVSYANTVLVGKGQCGSYGTCFWTWFIAVFLMVLLLPLSFLVLRRNNKELRYRLKTLLR